MRYLSLAVALVNTLMVLGQGSFTFVPVLSSSVTPKPTVHPSSTVTPTMTPLTTFCHSVLDSKNRTCVRVCFDLLNVTTTFNASTKHSTNGTTVPFSGLISPQGICSKPSGAYNVSSITLVWSPFSVTLNFSSNNKEIPGKKVNGGVKQWYLSSVHFKNGTKWYHQNTTCNATIAATIGDSYKCDNTLVFRLNSKDTKEDTFATLQLTDYTVQAFAAPEKTFKFGDTINCVTEANLPAYIPIIVGCALAGLVLLVLVAYVIGRCYKRKQDDYELLS